VRSAGRIRPVRALVGGGLLVTIVALPALLAGTGIDAPPRPDELQRLADALRGPPALGEAGSEVARQFYLAAVHGSAGRLPAEPAALSAFVATARLAQLGGLFATTACVYLATALARTRAQGLLACLFLLLLPPVAADGHALRPETPATLFAAFALLLLQGLARVDPVRARRSPLSRVAVPAATSVLAALALSLAVAALPARGAVVLLPGAVLTVLAAQLLLRGRRVWRRQELSGLPIQAINRRLWPWLLAAMLVPAAAFWLLELAVRVPAGALQPTAAVAGLLPASPLQRGALLALLVVGAFTAVVRVGLRTGRRGRVGPDLVLLVYCGLQLAAAWAAGPGTDMLPAVPALAVLLAEGASAVATLGAWLLLRRRRALTSARRSGSR